VSRYDHRDTGRSVSYEPGRPEYSSTDLIADSVGVIDIARRIRCSCSSTERRWPGRSRCTAAHARGNRTRIRASRLGDHRPPHPRAHRPRRSWQVTRRSSSGQPQPSVPVSKTFSRIHRKAWEGPRRPGCATRPPLCERGCRWIAATTWGVSVAASRTTRRASAREWVMTLRGGQPPPHLPRLASGLGALGRYRRTRRRRFARSLSVHSGR
jgi:hypothetical protein